MPNPFKTKARTLNIVVFGESGVGKTSFTDKVTRNGQFVVWNPVPTSDGHPGFHNDSELALDFEGDIYHLQFEDISLTPIREQPPGGNGVLVSDIFARSFHSVDGVVLLYDVTNFKSYDEVTEVGWDYVCGCRKGGDGVVNYPLGHQRFGCVLVGNKIDLVQGEGKAKKEVSKDLAEEWADMMGVKAFEVDRFDRERLVEVTRTLLRSIKKTQSRDKEDVQTVKEKLATMQDPKEKGKGKNRLSLASIRNALPSIRPKPKPSA